jgi:hypothetical protein
MQEDLERFLAVERHAVTSTKIADELRDLLGDEVARPASLDTRPEVVAWLRSDPSAAPIPLTKPASPGGETTHARPRWIAMAMGAAVVASVIAALAIAASMGDAEEPSAAPSTAVAPPPEVSATDEGPGEAPAETEPAIAATPPDEVVAPPSEAVAPAEGAEDEEEAARARRHEERERRRSATRAAPGGFVEDPGF